MARPGVSPRRATRMPRASPPCYQELLLFPELTVAENIFLGHAPKTSLGTLDWTRHARAAPASCSTPRQPRARHRREGGKPFGGQPPAGRDRQGALRRTPASLIMDEPTAALAEADVQRLMAIVRKLRARGVAIVYVSHRMPEIFALADRVTVLRDGDLIGTMDIADVDESRLVAMMVGRADRPALPASQATKRRRRAGAARRLATARWSATSPSICAHGEILGLAGPGRLGPHRSSRSPSSASPRPPPARS